VYGPRGLTLCLMAKHTGRKAMTEAGRQARPVESDGTGRELAVYRHILAGAGLATPTLIGGWSGPSRGVLVLERVPGTPLTEVGDFGAWEGAARWLARMHATFAATPPSIAAFGTAASLARYDWDRLDAAGTRGLARAAEHGLGSCGARAALARAHEQGLGTLTSTTSTLVHGDFYPSNIMVAGERIAVLDWELAGTGPAELDLAALLAGGWGDEQRAALAMAYYEEAVAARGVTEPLAALLWRVALASVHLALRWLGSESGWKAPDEHHRDWFADALAALAHLEGCTS
jgi:aminoglycoside phosphotransferase (APT) family kinase protein